MRGLIYREPIMHLTEREPNVLVHDKIVLRMPLTYC